jgi:hypothetical protein
MRLILLPISPFGKGGYNKAVAQDIDRLYVQKSDHVIIYNHPGQEVPDGFDVITRPPLYSFQRLINTLTLRVSTDLPPNLLHEKIKEHTYDEIFCGDVMLYRSVRNIFPNKLIEVRFHNMFFLSYVRNQFRTFNVGLKFRLNLILFSKLELKILRDFNVLPIFINETEKNFFKLMFPERQSKLWSPQISKQILPEKINKRAFIYFGSYAHHQTPGIIWFLQNIFTQLRTLHNSFTVHFWGTGGDFLDDPERGIFSHGFYDKDGLPMMGEGMYINPDLLGGGIKYKIVDWIEKGVPFISTPFGVEGYKFEINENIIIADIEKWMEKIETYFNLLK